MDPSCTPQPKATSLIPSAEKADAVGGTASLSPSGQGGPSKPKNPALPVPPPPCSGWHRLPEEILLFILTRLKDGERLGLRAVCKDWKKIIESHRLGRVLHFLPDTLRFNDYVAQEYAADARSLCFFDVPRDESYELMKKCARFCGPDLRYVVFMGHRKTGALSVTSQGERISKKSEMDKRDAGFWWLLCPLLSGKNGIQADDSGPSGMSPESANTAKKRKGEGDEGKSENTVAPLNSEEGQKEVARPLEHLGLVSFFLSGRVCVCLLTPA